MGDSLIDSAANRAMTQKAKDLLAKLFIEGTQRGYYGKLAVELDSKDGTIMGVSERKEKHHR